MVKINSKYYPLERYLQNSRKKCEGLTFSEIEKILNFQLPKSAYKYEAWWSNDKYHVQAKSWLNAGWKSCCLDMGKQRIVFKKD